MTNPKERVGQAGDGDESNTGKPVYRNKTKTLED